MNAAHHVLRAHQEGTKLAVVVSAMAGETNRLETLAQKMSAHNDDAHDLILASGEQITVGLMTHALRTLNLKAEPFLAWQLPIISDDAHGKARILSIVTDKIEALWKKNVIAVVAGFQGVSAQGKVTSLGRGGSDTSAVALAIALKAQRCDIYTDVAGVYFTDPRLVPHTPKRKEIAYEEMLEMSAAGSKVLHARASGLAMRHKMPLIIRSSLTDEDGTMITSEDKLLEQPDVSGITHNEDVAKVTLIEVDDRPGVAALIFDSLLKKNIIVDMIVQNIAAATKKTDVTFTVARKDLPNTRELLKQNQKIIGFKELICDDRVAQISIIGIGMRNHHGIAATMFAALAQEKINIEVISTSEIKVSVLIEEKNTKKAICALHDAFAL